MNASGTELRVCQDIADRQKKGVKKYGTTVNQNPLPLRAWLQHAYEECLDQAVYLKRAMEEMDIDFVPDRFLKRSEILCIAERIELSNRNTAACIYNGVESILYSENTGEMVFFFYRDSKDTVKLMKGLIADKEASKAIVNAIDCATGIIPDRISIGICEDDKKKWMEKDAAD